MARGQVWLWNRRATEATATFPELSALAEAEGRSVVLDGEVVAPDAAGRPSFQRLQRRMYVVRPSSRLVAEVPVVFAAFDVLWLDGASSSGCPRPSAGGSSRAWPRRDRSPRPRPCPSGAPRGS